MKRIGNLYDKVCRLDNLYLAYDKARKGKARQYGVRLFEKDIEGNLHQLYNELVNEAYRTSEYKVFTIYDPKEREISSLPFRDRIVHHAIMNVMEPIWTSVFIRQTYSCIKGRGIHDVLNHLKRDLKDVENTRYCLKIDIRKFYPSIDHDILKSIIRKKIKDARLLKLLDEIIDHGNGRYIVKIKHEGIERKFFTNAAPIKGALDQISKDGFPFLTTIKQQRFGSGSGKTFYFT